MPLVESQSQSRVSRHASERRLVPVRSVIRPNERPAPELSTHPGKYSIPGADICRIPSLGGARTERPSLLNNANVIESTPGHSRNVDVMYERVHLNPYYGVPLAITRVSTSSRTVFTIFHCFMDNG